MAELKKFVECTPEQYITLLKEGQIEINGEIKTKEENTYYMPGELVLLEWYNKIMNAQYRKYKVNHSPMNIKSLEQEYNELIEKDSALASVSAIGYNAILENGDKIVVNEPNKGDFYIDGKKVEADYTYTGDGFEAVNVWVFEHISEDGTVLPPTLVDEATFDIIELDVRNIVAIPVVGDSYKNYASILRTCNFTVNGVATRKLISNGVGVFNQTAISSTIEEVESDCITINDTVNPFVNKTNLKKAVFPKLISMTLTNQNNVLTFFNGCNNKDLEIIFPNLKEIRWKDITSDWGCPFRYVKKLIIPQSVEIIFGLICSNNEVVILNCNKATSISSRWCYKTPTENFTMCSDWQADINIATAAAKHTIDWFFPRYDDVTGKLTYETPLFTHILHNFTIDNENLPEETEPHTGSIKLPATIYEQMTDADRELASSIGWNLLDDPYKTSEV